MATSHVASTCPEPNTVPTTIHSLLLERLFIAAVSALGSVTVTLGIIKCRVRKSRRVGFLLSRPSDSLHSGTNALPRERHCAMQVHEDEQPAQEEKTLAEDTVALEKQLAWSEHRMRELESLVESTVSLSHASACCPASLPESTSRDGADIRAMQPSNPPP